MSIKDETIGGYTASKALQYRVGMVVMYQHRMYSIGIDTVLIEGILQVLFSPAFFMLDTVVIQYIPE